MGNGKLEILDKKELVEKLIDRVGNFNVHFHATFVNPDKVKKFGFVKMDDERFTEFRKKKDNSLTIKDGLKKVYNPYYGNVTKKADTIFMTGFRYKDSLERRSEGEQTVSEGYSCPKRVILNRNKKPSPLAILKKHILPNGKTIENPRLYLWGEYVSSNSEFFTNDTDHPIDKADLKPFISVPKENPNKPKMIAFQGPDLDNIDRIKIDGQWYGLYKGPKVSGVADVIPTFEMEPETE